MDRPPTRSRSAEHVAGRSAAPPRQGQRQGHRVGPVGQRQEERDGHGEGAEEFKAKLARDVLFPKRLGRGEEFATLCVELLANSYINAESIRLDAGIRMQPK